jgi:predicted CXXCH cytochrome family protein
MRLLTLSGVLVVLLSALTAGQTPPDCWDCHRDKLDRAAFESSVHNDLACTDCHSDAQSVPHEQRPRRPSPQVCAGCHPSQASEYQQSIHGRARAQGISEAAHCADCHSAHTVFSKADPRSSVFVRNLPRPADAATKIRESRSASASPRAATPHILRAITASPSNMGASSPPTVPVATGAISS